MLSTKALGLTGDTKLKESTAYHKPQINEAFENQVQGGTEEVQITKDLIKNTGSKKISKGGHKIVRNISLIRED